MDVTWEIEASGPKHSPLCLGGQHIQLQGSTVDPEQHGLELWGLIYTQIFFLNQYNAVL